MTAPTTSPNYIKAEAASLAVLQRFSIGEPNFDIEDLAYVLGIEVKYGGLSSGDARIVRTDEGRGVIRLNKSILDPARRRFSIAHEIGHWEMHPNISQGYLCSASDLRDYGRSAEEAEANWFAATLLMPRFLIPPGVFKQDPSFDFLMRFAGNFGTSLTAATRRYVELSRQPMVLVASAQGRVTWIARSKAAGDKFYFVTSGSEVPEHSVTIEVVRSESTEAVSHQIEPQVWFPELNFDDEVELFEHVKYSDIYGTALTLLWIPQ